MKAKHTRVGNTCMIKSCYRVNWVFKPCHQWRWKRRCGKWRLTYRKLRACTSRSGWLQIKWDIFTELGREPTI